MRRSSGTVQRATFVDSISTQSLDLKTSMTISTLSFASLKQRRRKLRFEARFKLFNEEKAEGEQVLVFQLVQLKNGWRIDDIIYTKNNASLKAVLTAIIDEAAQLKE